MAIRAQPVKSVFSRMPRLVRELAAKTGKKIKLETIGENTEIDKTIIEQLSDPLTHMIRNSADHGIETPESAPRGRQARDRHHPALGRAGRRQHPDRRSRTTARGINRERVLQVARDRVRGRPRPAADRRADRPADLCARLLDRRRSLATFPAAASAWTWCSPTSRRSAARCMCRARDRQGHAHDAAPAADARGARRHAGQGRRARPTSSRCQLDRRDHPVRARQFRRACRPAARCCRCAANMCRWSTWPQRFEMHTDADARQPLRRAVRGRRRRQGGAGGRRHHRPAAGGDQKPRGELPVASTASPAAPSSATAMSP